MLLRIQKIRNLTLEQMEIIFKLDERHLQLMARIEHQQRHIMSALTDLQATLAATNTNVAALAAAVTIAITDLTPGTTGSGATESQVAAINTALAAANTQLAGITIAINAAVAALTPPVIPVAPVSVTATAQGSGIVALAFPVVAGATSYSISRSTAPGAEVLVGTSPTNSFTDTGLVTGTPYFYTVIATNAAGASPASTEITVTA